MRFVLMSCLFALMCPLCSQAEPTPATQTWDYLMIKDVAELNRAIPDPTQACGKAALLVVLGHLGWEVVQVIDDSRQALSAASGTLRLDKPGYNGTQTGAILLKAESRGALRVLFKRPMPHEMAGRACPSSPE
ncbi:hypothetical protein [Rhizobacter sp. Root1221]|uniref:hypothetical protein n=1 Tax=Rhizobacter sp. Root1221 TaxID=1736433 RepID=UPI000A5D2682|nr:hypothetical protein [Rhizobacter sp. Root1221]